jgi:hypothetical protein
LVADQGENGRRASPYVEALVTEFLTFGAEKGLAVLSRQRGIALLESRAVRAELRAAELEAQGLYFESNIAKAEALQLRRMARGERFGLEALSTGTRVEHGTTGNSGTLVQSSAGREIEVLEELRRRIPNSPLSYDQAVLDQMVRDGRVVFFKRTDLLLEDGLQIGQRIGTAATHPETGRIYIHQATWDRLVGDPGRRSRLLLEELDHSRRILSWTEENRPFRQTLYNYSALFRFQDEARAGAAAMGSRWYGVRYGLTYNYNQSFLSGVWYNTRMVLEAAVLTSPIWGPLTVYLYNKSDNEDK